MQEKEKIAHFSHFLRTAMKSPCPELARVGSMHAQCIKSGKSVGYILKVNKPVGDGIVYTPPIKLIKFEKLTLREKLAQYGATVQALSSEASLSAHAFTVNFDQHQTESFINRAQNAPKSNKAATEVYSNRINKILEKHFSHFTYVFENAPRYEREDGSIRENMIHIHGILLAPSDTEQSEIRKILNKISTKLRKRGTGALKAQVSLQNAYFPAGFLDYALAENIDGKKQANDKVFNYPRSGKRIHVSGALVGDTRVYHQAVIETLSEGQQGEVMENSDNHSCIEEKPLDLIDEEEGSANHLLNPKRPTKKQIEEALSPELDALLDDPEQFASKPQIRPLTIICQESAPWTKVFNPNRQPKSVVRIKKRGVLEI